MINLIATAYIPYPDSGANWVDNYKTYRCPSTYRNTKPVTDKLILTGAIQILTVCQRLQL